MVEADLWDLARTQRCTSLPGTPFHYKVVQRLGLDALDLPDLAVLTQAGGHLAPKLAAAMHQVMEARHGRFYVMYGQTEASPRMTVLAHDEFARPARFGRAGAEGRNDPHPRRPGTLPCARQPSARWSIVAPTS